MKNAHTPRFARTLILGIACLGLNGQMFAQNTITSSGTLIVDSTLVLTEPQSVTDNVEVSPTTITSTEELNMRVRVLRANLSYNTKRSTIGNQPVEVVWSKNKSVWSRIFYGSQSTVVPTAIVLDTVIAKTDIVDFGARGYLSDWLPLYCTSSACHNLIVLKNGDPTPPQISNKKYGQIDGFLKPYLSNDLQTVNIGNNELLILVELDQTEPFAVGFDYQDVGLLVTFD